jgi:hypothetical protein
MKYNPEPGPTQSHFLLVRRMKMRESKSEPYTVEQLQQQYAVSMQVAVGVMEQFGGDRSRIDKFLKRWPQKRAKPMAAGKN